MISKSNAKFIKSLQLKKYRKQEQLFLVEGAKSVLEVFNSGFEVKQLLATPLFLKENPHFSHLDVMEKTSPEQLKSIGTLKNNNMALAVVKMQPEKALQIDPYKWTIALDDINDPGNLGTIIRIADWYGIDQLVASMQTAEFYNPKVIAASKGSFCRVKINYLDLKDFLKKTSLLIYGAMMNGKDVHTTSFEAGGVLVMGNEANGISQEIEPLLNKKITIPRYGKAESLNVAMATAIICDNIKRAQH